MTHIVMRKPDICIRNGGVINLSSNVVSALNLREGDVVSVMEDSDKELYLYVYCRREDAVGNYSGICRASKKNSRHLRAHSTTLCAFLDKTIGGKNIDLIVGEKVTLPLGDALPLIKRNIYDRRNQV